MEKELKIEVPQGYEIDRQKSTFEKIVFKKIPENPKTWEEYCSLVKGKTSHYTNCDNHIIISGFSGAHNKFATKERAEQFIALGKLLQLRDYWVGDWLPNPDYLATVVYCSETKTIIIDTDYFSDYPLTFPTKEMAQKFIDCFEDLIKQAFPLV